MKNASGRCLMLTTTHATGIRPTENLINVSLSPRPCFIAVRVVHAISPCVAPRRVLCRGRTNRVNAPPRVRVWAVCTRAISFVKGFNYLEINETSVVFIISLVVRQKPMDTSLLRHWLLCPLDTRYSDLYFSRRFSIIIYYAYISLPPCTSFAYNGGRKNAQRGQLPRSEKNEKQAVDDASRFWTGLVWTVQYQMFFGKHKI